MVRDGDYRKLERQPLTLVLAEFRFGRVTFEPAALAALKERMARRFTDVTEGVAQQVQLGDAGVTIMPAPYVIWRTPETGVAVHLEVDRIAYATTMYPRFEGFAKDCLAVVEALLETLCPPSLHRVGLRYNDAVVPMPHESLERYVAAPLLPFSALAANGDTVTRHLSETVVQTTAGALVVRALAGVHGLGMMPDLLGQFDLPLKVEVPNDRPVAVLDFDHYWEVAETEGVAFDVDAARSRLDRLHEPAREAFWKVTTEFARTQRWN